MRNLGQKHPPLEQGCPPTALMKKDRVGRKPKPGSHSGTSCCWPRDLAYRQPRLPSAHQTPRQLLPQRAGSASPRAGEGARPLQCNKQRDMAAGPSAGDETQHIYSRTQVERHQCESTPIKTCESTLYKREWRFGNTGRRSLRGVIWRDFSRSGFFCLPGGAGDSAKAFF